MQTEYTNTVLYTDALSGLQKLKTAGVVCQCGVTSPPYWKQKDYGHPDQLGQEDTIEEYLQHLFDVFMAVGDVLADDGVLWINIDDVYNKTGGSGGDYSPGGRRHGQPKCKGRNVPWLKNKELCGIPWRLAMMCGLRQTARTPAGPTNRIVHMSRCYKCASPRTRTTTWRLPGSLQKHRRSEPSAMFIAARAKQRLHSTRRILTDRGCEVYGLSRPRNSRDRIML